MSLHISMPVDGYTAGAIDRLSAGEKFGRSVDQLLESIDGVVFGHVVSEPLAAFPPSACSDASPTNVSYKAASR